MTQELGMPRADASVARSPPPAGIHKLHVFISYSRADLAFADQLDAALDVCGFECTLDRQGISGGEDWKARLGSLLREAETVVFVLSPDSAKSEICNWEVEEAARFGKRIIPVICRPLDGQSAPPRLTDLNYIFFYPDPKAPGSGFGSGLARLVTALNTDLDWLREHTRYLQRATEWDAGGRPANRLLSGIDIAEAKAWASRRPKDAPEPTALHLDYVRASEHEDATRTNAQRQQLEAMAAAQAERQKALERAEIALKQAAEEQKQKARVRNIALVVVSAVGLLAAWQWRDAVAQRTLAETSQQKALSLLESATDLIGNVTRRVDADDDTKVKVAGVFRQGVAMGNSSALANMGWAHASGYGVDRNPNLALQHFLSAAKMGNSYAMTELARMHRVGDLGKPDYPVAKRWAEQALTLKEPRAMVELAFLHFYGLGIQKSLPTAVKLFEAAAELADTEAMLNLANIYYYGDGVPQSFAKARAWYEKAANKGDMDAQAEIGWLHDNGLGIERDSGKGLSILERAAAQGSVSAMLLLGDRHVGGWGGVRDIAAAAKWFEKARDKHDDADLFVERMVIEQALDLQRYDGLTEMQHRIIELAERIDVRSNGEPRARTAGELARASLLALLAGDADRALQLAEQAEARMPEDLSIRAARGHALMVVGRTDEARSIYLANQGKTVRSQYGKPWVRVVFEDFGRLRRAKLALPLMAEIETELEIKR